MAIGVFMILIVAFRVWGRFCYANHALNAGEASQERSASPHFGSAEAKKNGGDRSPFAANSILLVFQHNTEDSVKWQEILRRQKIKSLQMYISDIYN